MTWGQHSSLIPCVRYRTTLFAYGMDDRGIDGTGDDDMQANNPMTETMKASDARQQFSDVLNRVYRHEARVVVERSGIPVAAIVSAEDLARLRQYDEERAARFA